jgi:hypothetical protein
MNRKVFVVSLLALGGLVTAAEVRSSRAEQQQRLQDFQKKAKEARKAQKLEGDREALVTKYPTPELDFIELQEVRAGAEVTLAATGQYVPGSLVVVPCDGIEVVSTKVTAERAEARVRVLPNAKPADCDLQVVSPVSAISRSQRALRIKVESVWDLKLSNGLTARWRVGMDKSGLALAGESEWFEKGKSLGTRPVVIALSGDDARVTVAPSDEETQQGVKNADANAQDMEALGKKMEALFKKMDAECSKLPAEKQSACAEKYQPQMEALNKAFNEGGELEQMAVGVPSAVCAELTLKAVGGKVTGTADKCASGSGVKVSGTYKPLTGK